MAHKKIRRSPMEHRHIMVRMKSMYRESRWGLSPGKILGVAKFDEMDTYGLGRCAGRAPQGTLLTSSLPSFDTALAVWKLLEAEKSEE